MMSLPQRTRQLTTQNQAIEPPLGYTFWDASAPLILLAARARYLPKDTDLIGLQKKLIVDVQTFERHLQEKNIRVEQILMGKYFICALLDELLEFEWLEGQAFWKAYSLLHHFFQETSADEKFFILLERLQQEPSANLPLLELAYMVLVYGFQGKYRKQVDGYFITMQHLNALYHHLNWHYDELRKSLFISDRT